MRYLISEILETVNTAVVRTGHPIRKILAILGIAPSSYYSWLKPSTMDGRFNPYAVRDEEWLIVGFKMKHPNLRFRELGYTMIDEDVAYVSPSTVYAVLRKHGLVTTRKEKIFLSKLIYCLIRRDEIWQCDIMYVKVKGRFFYLIVFIDVFSCT